MTVLEATVGLIEGMVGKVRDVTVLAVGELFGTAWMLIRLLGITVVPIAVAELVQVVAEFLDIWQVIPVVTPSTWTVKV